MGTSQSFKLNSGPNWSSAKRAMTSIAKQTGNTERNMSSFMSGMNKGLGNSLYRGKGNHAGGGRSNSFGKAGGNRLNNFMSFISGVNSNGLVDTLGIKKNNNQILSVNEYIDLILQKVTDENNSNLDDTAATVAMDTLLHEILNECKDEQSIEDRLKSATDDDKINWIISYEVKYIMEYSAELFQSHIFDKEGNPNKICNEIENWLHKEIDENLSKDLYRTDFNSPEGRERIDKLTSEILDIWKPE